jgi:hypothetical protein
VGARADPADGRDGAAGADNAEHGDQDGEEVLVWGWAGWVGEGRCVVGANHSNTGSSVWRHFWGWSWLAGRRIVKECCWSGDNDDADEGQEGGQLLLSGKCFARYEQGADIAAQDRGEEGENGRFSEGQVEQGEIQAKNAEEPEDAAGDEQGEDITGSEGEMGNVRVVTICKGKGGS